MLFDPSGTLYYFHNGVEQIAWMSSARTNSCYARVLQKSNVSVCVTQSENPDR